MMNFLYELAYRIDGCALDDGQYTLLEFLDLLERRVIVEMMVDDIVTGALVAVLCVMLGVLIGSIWFGGKEDEENEEVDA